MPADRTWTASAHARFDSPAHYDAKASKGEISLTAEVKAVTAEEAAEKMVRRVRAHVTEVTGRRDDAGPFITSLTSSAALAE
jgi:hypothetical protein